MSDTNSTIINQAVEGDKLKQVASEVVESITPVPPPMVIFKGRRKIYTNYLAASQANDDNLYPVLNAENIVTALNDALKIHYLNAEEIRALLNYYKGEQSIFYRTKDVRPDVDNRVVINYANTFTRDIIGYTFGKPMQYVARRSDTSEGESSVKEEIRLLNDYAEMNHKFTSDQEKATNASIFGISHRAIFLRKNEDENEAPYYYINLDSENTFVAYSSQMNREPVFACTYTRSFGTGENNFVLFTVYTPDEVYRFKVPYSSGYYTDTKVFATVCPEHLVVGYPKPNPMGMIPIIENENNQFRMGHWETAITVLDAINKVASDSVNDVEQFVNAILVSINAEFTEEQMKNVRENKYAEIKSFQGMPADLKYIQAQLDGSSVQQLREYLEECLRAVVGIPDRKTRGGGGGDTGDAVKLRDGWADLEVVARTTESFNEASEKKELKIILKLLKDLKKISKTSMINIDIKYPRNKTDNLNNKVTAYSTMLSTETLAPEDALEIVDITSDNAEVIQRGELYWKKKREQNIEEQQRLLNTGTDEVTQKGGNEDVRTDEPDSTKSGNNK